MAQIVEHPEGVYLNMMTQAYYADPAIGGSSLKTLISSCPDWWWSSPYNTLVPQKEATDDESRAMRFGTAVHCALLESMEVFNAVYGVCPDKFTHPRALATSDDLKARLRELGEKVSGSKPELVERLRQADPTAQILEDLIEAWMAEGRKPLSRVEFNKIHLMHRILMGRPEQPTDLGKAFVGGLSEVSVFWTDENGVRHRARFDKIKPNSTIELKTFSNWQGRDFNKAILREAAIRGYHIAAAHYEEARRQLRRLVAEGKVFYPKTEVPELRAKIDADRKLLEEIAKADKWKFVWVFFKTDGAPRAKGVVMDFAKSHENIYLEGKGRRDEALANFLNYRAVYGLSDESPMWRDPETLWTPDTADWPFFAQVAD